MGICKDSFGTRSTLMTQEGPVTYFNINKLSDAGFEDIDRLPFSIKILLENLLRNEDGKIVSSTDIENMIQWNSNSSGTNEVPFMPARVLLQDFTGVPAVLDMAAMREAAKRLYGDPMRINPIIPAELVVDHSVQVDSFGSKTSFKENVEKEFQRNSERYAFLKWGQKNFANFQIVPPATGICHQVNIEYLARVVFIKEIYGKKTAFPDTLVGLDSHTTMVNGIGVLGWGVGGIEAEAVMLGRPYYLLMPQVVGFKLTGRIPDGTTAMDLVLTITELLRKKGVVGKFVEFYGPGIKTLNIEDRATIANMAPEYGATAGFFPVDEKTTAYLRLTGRTENSIDLIENYCKEQGLFKSDGTPTPVFTETLHLDMNTIQPCLAGPSRPQERVPVFQMKQYFENVFGKAFETGKRFDELEKKKINLCHGSVVIAAITSCTNTSNPSALIGAGLLAKKAVKHGLVVKPWVKTSLAPGSKVVINYLKASGLLSFLEELGFYLVAYGCTTCIGNSGPLSDTIADEIKDRELLAAAVLSGNRNFEGRINPLIRANFLASPPLVVAYAIAGKLDIDFETEPLGFDSDGKPVYLQDIWPDTKEIRETIKNFVNPKTYHNEYATVFEGSNRWKSLPAPEGDLYNWDPKSTYIKEPLFFKKITHAVPKLQDIKGARILVLLGHAVTTDHISPAGAIPIESPAGTYLINQGVKFSEFNSFGSRRGNHEIMIRGTFGNIRLKNQVVPGTNGGWTSFFPDGKKMTIYDAAMLYQKKETPLLVIAGREYGTGSSRDWAAKGTALLGIKAVIAEGFERIHRSNLVCMGVLPLQFKQGENHETLKLKGTELFDITGIEKEFEPGEELSVCAQRKDGKKVEFKVIARIDSSVELDYYRHGGILAYVLRHLK